MRRIAILLAFLAASTLGTSAAPLRDTSPDCIATASKSCVALWLRDSVVSMMASGDASAFQLLPQVTEELAAVGEVDAALGLIDAIPASLVPGGQPAADLGKAQMLPRLGQFSIMREAPQFRARVPGALSLVTVSLLSDHLRPYSWGGLVVLARTLGFSREADEALSSAVAAVRSGAFDDLKDRDALIGAIIDGVIDLKDFSLARDLVQYVKSDRIVRDYASRIDRAETSAEQIDPPTPAGALGVLLTQSRFADAMALADSTADGDLASAFYAALALEAARGGDVAAARAALAKYDAQSGQTLEPSTALACALKRGYTNALLGDTFDVDAYRTSIRALTNAVPQLEIGGLFVSFDRWAIEMLAGHEDEVLTELNGPEGAHNELDLAASYAGAAATAMGVAGDRAIPAMREALQRVARLPDGPQKIQLLQLMARLISSDHIAFEQCPPGLWSERAD